MWPLASGHFFPWQIVSYAFLHGDMVHLFFNMLGLWMFGAELERLWGRNRYLQLLLASVIARPAGIGCVCSSNSIFPITSLKVGFRTRPTRTAG